MLQLAAKHGHKSLVNWLIKSGAALDSADKFGFTALHDAAENGQTSIVRALVKAGADPSLTTFKEVGGIAVGTSPTDVAESGGHSAAAKILRKAMG